MEKPTSLAAQRAIFSEDALLSKVSLLSQAKQTGYYAFRCDSEIVEQEYPDLLGLGNKVSGHFFE